MRWWRAILCWYYRNDFGPEEAEQLARMGLAARYRRVTEALYKPWAPQPVMIGLEDLTIKAKHVAEGIARVREILGDSDWLVLLGYQLDEVMGEIQCLDAEKVDRCEIEELWRRLGEIHSVLSADQGVEVLTWGPGSPRIPKISFANLDEANIAMEAANRKAAAAYEEAKRLDDELKVAKGSGRTDLGPLEESAEKAKVAFVTAQDAARSLDREIQFLVEKQRFYKQAKELRDSVRTTFDEITKFQIEVAKSQGEDVQCEHGKPS